MEKAPGVQGSAGRAQQQTQGQEDTYDLGHESVGRQQEQGTYELATQGTADTEATYELATQVTAGAEATYLDTAPHPEPNQQTMAGFGSSGEVDFAGVAAAAPGYLDVAGSNTTETTMTSYDHSTDDEEI